MVLRHTIPPRRRQIEGDGRGADDGPHEDSSDQDKTKDDGAKRPEKAPQSTVNSGNTDLERKQNAEREKTYGREQGGNQQGNQRGIGNPGDR
jgi:hypothetical protein